MFFPAACARIEVVRHIVSRLFRARHSVFTIQRPEDSNALVSFVIKGEDGLALQMHSIDPWIANIAVRGFLLSVL